MTEPTCTYDEVPGSSKNLASKSTTGAKSKPGTTYAPSFEEKNMIARVDGMRIANVGFLFFS